MNPNDLLAFRNRYAQEQALAQQTRAADREQEKARSTMEQILYPIVGSVGNTLGGSVTGLGQLLGTGIEALTPWNGVGQNIRQDSTDLRNSLAKMVADSRFQTEARPGENSFITNLSSGLGSLATSMGTYGLTRSSALPALMFGASAGGEQAQGAIDAGKSPMQAFLTGAVAGGAEAGLEKVGLDKYMGAGGGLLPRLGKRMATEGTQEFLQSLAQSGVRSTYDNVNFGDALKQAGIEGGYGALVGGLGDVSIRTGGAMRNMPVPGLSMQDVSKTGDNFLVVNQEGEVNVKQLSQLALNSLAQDQDGIKPKAVERAKIEIENGTAKPIRIRRLDDGSVSIEDGRHRLQAAVELGLETYPIEDVSAEYADPKSLPKEYRQVDATKLKGVALQSHLARTAQEQENQPVDELRNELAMMKYGGNTQKVGITNMFGGTTTQSDLDYQSGLAKGIDQEALGKQAVHFGDKQIQKTFHQSGIKVKIRPATGLYGGNIEPSLDMTADVSAKNEAQFLNKLADLGEKNFDQESVITRKIVEDDDTPWGFVDEKTGLSREPAYTVHLKDKADVAQVLEESGLPGATLRNDGTAIDIVNLSYYNKDYESYRESVTKFVQALKERGLLERAEYGVAEVRHFGREGSAPASYEQIRSAFNQGVGAVETHQSRILDRIPKKPLISRPEIEQLLRQPDITTAEKDYTSRILDSIDWNQNSLLPDGGRGGRIPTGQFINTFQEGLLPTTREASDRWADYGIENLGVDYENAETIIVRQPLEHGESGHFGTKDDFGHYRTFERNDVGVRKRYTLNNSNDNIRILEAQIGVLDAALEGKDTETLNTMMRESKIYFQEQYNPIGKDKQQIQNTRNALQEDLEMNRNKAREAKKDLAKIKERPIYVAEIQADAFQRGAIDEGIEDKGVNYLKQQIESRKEGIKSATEGQALDKNKIKELKKEIAEKKKELEGVKEKPSLLAVAKVREGYTDESVRTRLLEDNPTVLEQRLVNSTGEAMTNRAKQAQILKSAITTLEGNVGTLEDSIRIRETTIDGDKKNLAILQGKLKDAESELKEKKAKGYGSQLANFAKDNRYRRRLLEETLIQLRDDGYNEIYLPTPSTVAKVEWGYGSEDSAPYRNVAGTAFSQDTRLDVGDVIDYGGQEMTVVATDGNSIEVANSEEVYIYDTHQFIQEQASADVYDNAQYELQSELEKGISPEYAEELKANAAWVTERVLDKIIEGDEIINTANADKVFDAVYNELVDGDYYNPMDYFDFTSFGWTGNGESFITTDETTETLYQPDAYESTYNADEIREIDKNKREAENRMNEDEMGVLNNYYEMQKILAKIQKETDIAVEYTTDDEGNTWFKVIPNKNLKRTAF